MWRNTLVYRVRTMSRWSEVRRMSLKFRPPVPALCRFLLRLWTRATQPVALKWPTSSLPVLRFSHCKSSCRPLDFRSCARVKYDAKRSGVKTFVPPASPATELARAGSRCFRPSTRVEREEQKESQAAACGRRPLKAVAACDSFCSSRSTRVDGRKHRDLLWPAIRGRRGGWNKGFDTGPFRYVFRSGTRPEV